ncbi:hypothetical protein PVK06_027951 [Gossypium arboreum]|uniref:Uncharacterized protein n=1 Tax=Gossypium arboreum TaxID=29729 RepID=A0ABR0P314_GOSAR|nr:hypothetical protein PVK06_027951 [Gossypium arboreum]
MIVSCLVKQMGEEHWFRRRFLRNMRIVQVSDLIDSCTRTSKVGVVEDTFSELDAKRILRIPLALVEHDDLVVWRGEPSGEYSEIEELEARNLTKQNMSVTWRPPEDGFVRINFNLAYNRHQFRSTSWLVARNNRGVVSHATLGKRLHLRLLLKVVHALGQ